MSSIKSTAGAVLFCLLGTAVLAPAQAEEMKNMMSGAAQEGTMSGAPMKDGACHDMAAKDCMNPDMKNAVTPSMPQDPPKDSMKPPK